MKARVIVLHGLGMSNTSMCDVVKNLNKNGFDALAIDYNTFNLNLNNLSDVIREHAFGRPVVHYVGHSLGGCVIREMFDKGLLPAPSVHTKVVTLGAPLLGSSTAMSVVNLLGDAAPLFMPNKKQWKHKNKFLSISGNTPTVQGVSTFLTLNPLKLFEPNDGAVLVSETKIKGAEHLTLDVDHAKLIHSEQVMKEVVSFLK